MLLHTQPISSSLMKCTWWLPVLLVKVKVKIWRWTLCLIKHHAMRTYLGSGSVDGQILNLSTRWRWVVSLWPICFTSGERTLGIYWIGVWVGPIAGLDAVTGKNPSSCQELNPGCPAHSLVTLLTELPSVSVLFLILNQMNGVSQRSAKCWRSFHLWGNWKNSYQTALKILL
jgi:hypothetical protein